MLNRQQEKYGGKVHGVSPGSRQAGGLALGLRQSSPILSGGTYLY